MRFWIHTLALVAIMLAGFELACRWFIGFSPRDRFDPHYDRISKPDQPLVQAHEGFSRGRTNELGHLDRPMPSPLPSDGILVIGDSFTEARQVAREERFTDRLDTLVHRRVYNVGHTGWSPINAMAFLAAERATFAPSTVVVQVSGNDIEDLTAMKRPHLERAADGFKIVWPDRVKKGFGKKITAARDAISARSALAGDLIVAALTLFKGKGDDEGGGNESSCARPNSLAMQALPWLFGQLRAAHPDVRILYLPLLDYHAGCVDTCQSARDLFHAAAEVEHLPIIDPTDAMCARFAETRQPLNGFWNTVPGTGHMNAEGHEVVAHALADSLRNTTSAR